MPWLLGASLKVTLTCLQPNKCNQFHSQVSSALGSICTSEILTQHEFTIAGLWRARTKWDLINYCIYNAWPYVHVAIYHTHTWFFHNLLPQVWQQYLYAKALLFLCTRINRSDHGLAWQWPCAQMEVQPSTHWTPLGWTARPTAPQTPLPNISVTDLPKLLWLNAPNLLQPCSNI